MARKISFRTRVAECLDKGDASTFQSLINNKLVENLDIKKIGLISEMITEEDNESQIVSQLAATASSYGGNDMVYDMGVMDIRFNNPNAIKNFTEQLDKIDGVDYYEIQEPSISSENDTGATDLEYQGNKPVYEVTVYLNLDNVALPSDLDTYLENLDQFDEACGKKKKKAVNEKCKQEMGKKSDEESNDESDDGEEMEEGCKKKKPVVEGCKKKGEVVNPEDEMGDEMGDEESEDEMDDEECDDSEECDDTTKKESIQFSTIFDKVALHEFLTVKTAHWNQAMHKDLASTDKVCPPGRTGADCKTVLTAQQKMALRKRMAAHLKKLSGTRRSRMATHASATREFIKQHNLMSKSAAKARLNPGATEQ